MAFLVYEGSVLNYVLSNADFWYMEIRGTTKTCSAFYSYALVSGATNPEYLYLQLPKDRNAPSIEGTDQRCCTTFAILNHNLCEDTP